MRLLIFDSQESAIVIVIVSMLSKISMTKLNLTLITEQNTQHLSVFMCIMYCQIPILSFFQNECVQCL